MQGCTVSIFVETEDEDPRDQDYYGIFLNVYGGPFPCKATCTWELVHHDGDPQSAVTEEDEYTLTEVNASGTSRFFSKARLASRNNNPYVKDGYVTFKCTFKFVDE